METAADTGKGKGARGRKNRDKQEAVIETQKIADSIEELDELYKKANAAGDRLNDAIKAVAEKSGVLASVVRKLVVARASEKFEEKKREIEQLSLVFSEVGE